MDNKTNQKTKTVKTMSKKEIRDRMIRLHRLLLTTPKGFYSKMWEKELSELRKKRNS